ncbi:MAG: ABC transporter permease [Nonomuraea sp.]|nr:ABC transporter permease [Nonomuraea sp.]NUP62189.1 ABC transporter permease [Nonomuraea sp.]NUP76407.1 ABC transporter permease [Nonomuraea sp.]NUS02699.1 ABC transporter permease [Nonomuraea sp.]
MSAVPFRTLLLVEARKLVDTRSGRAVAAVMIALSVAAVAGRATVTEPRLVTLAGTAGIGYGPLLTVLAILTMTTEWSHRTALTTFALEPRRVRVLAAKCLPPLVMAMAAPLAALLVAVPVTAVAASVRGVPAVWEVAPSALLGTVVTTALLAAQALAMGLLLLNAPAAIVICLSNTLIWSTVALLGDAGAALAAWLDLNHTTDPLVNGRLTGGDAVRLAVSVTVWILAPMAAGAVRVIRKEVG